MMTLISALCLWVAGMNQFDALCHAMVAIATGGFSNYDNSIAHFNSIFIEIILSITMIAGCLPFVRYIQMAQGRYKALWKDSQVRVFMAILLLSILSVAFWLTMKLHMNFGHGLRLASFNVTSFMTTSGFSSANYMIWGSYPICLLFFLSFIGGCTGSTAGAIKVFRFQILYATVKAHLLQILHPHGIFKPQWNRKPIAEGVIHSVLVFFFVYISFFMIFAVLIACSGVDFITSISVVASSMSASGYSFGGHYADLPATAKWILSLTMMMGRLEFLTVLVLFIPAFWRD